MKNGVGSIHDMVINYREVSSLYARKSKDWCGNVFHCLHYAALFPCVC